MKFVKTNVMKTNIYNQHQEHTEWLNKLAFYKDELMIMQKRLDEVMSKNSNSEVKVKVEHFQNQIFIQEQNLSKLVHHINSEEKAIQSNIAQNPVASDHRKAEDHQEEREQVNFYEKNLGELKKEFNTFVSAWL